MTSRLSSAWAVRSALRLRGLDDLPEALIFGLGASAWYRLEPLRDPGHGQVLRALHPDRIKQSFFALNVYAVRFNYLSRDAQAQLRERTRLGVQTLISVDRFALPDMRHQASAGPACSLDYTLLVQADEQGGDADGFWVQGPCDTDPWRLTDSQLQAAWFYRHGHAETASFYWHPVLALNWQEAPALARALQCHAAQMQHSYPSLGPTGLRALEQLLVMLDEGDRTALASAARCAMADGGPALGRDLMAEFVRNAAERLQAQPLEQVAHHFDACAALWRELLQEFDHGRPGPAWARSGVAQVLWHERAALEALAPGLDAVRPGELACAS